MKPFIKRRKHVCKSIDAASILVLLRNGICTKAFVTGSVRLTNGTLEEVHGDI